jgi:hypothetical protein
LEDSGYITHWLNCYRTVEETPQKLKKAVWLHGEGKPDHFAHATVYFEIALQKTYSAGSVVTPPPVRKQDEHPIIAPDLTVPAMSITKLIANSQRKGRSWRAI